MSCATFDLAGIPIVFACEDPEWWHWASPRLAAFASPAEPTWEVTVEVTAPTPSFLRSPLEVYTEPLVVEGAPGGVRLHSGTFEAEIDVSRSRARVSGPLGLYPLDATLRHLVPLAVEDGLVLHGAMLADRGRGWLCSGPSGCGKSTLAKLLPEHACCDELAAVRRTADGWTLRSLPFWQARPATARLEGVYLLGHGTVHERRRATPADAVRQLTPQVLWPTASAVAMTRRLGLLAELVAQVPVWELHFSPVPSVWEVIVMSPAQPTPDVPSG